MRARFPSTAIAAPNIEFCNFSLENCGAIWAISMHLELESSSSYTNTAPQPYLEKLLPLGAPMKTYTPARSTARIEPN